MTLPRSNVSTTAASPSRLQGQDETSGNGGLAHLQAAGAIARRDVASKSSFAQLIGDTSSACEFMKLFSNETRLQILCALVEGDKSVSEIEELLNVRQPALSQQLARLRGEHVVSTVRDGKRVIYSLASDKIRTVVGVVYETFCLDGCEDRSCAVHGFRR